MTIERWDPFGEMLTLRDAMSRLLEDSFVRPSQSMARGMGQFAMPIDLRETDDQFIVEATLPGVKPEDIDVTVHGNQLQIQGEMKQEQEQKDERYHLRERRFGRFARTLALPTNIQADQVSCEYRDGMLKVTLPKAEAARPRRIQVSGGEDRQQQREGQERAVGQTSQQTGGQGQ
jgi:HSP20 family protein